MGKSHLLVFVAAAGVGLHCGGDNRPGPSGHVIEIDIDDHGLAGLWMARAPNLKGLIARGTLAFSRVDVPTHSNQNNMTLLTGQYPDGHDVPSNGWLSRAMGFRSPVNLPGLTVGDYALWDKNPLRTRGDSSYRAVHDAGGRSAYVGELPPFEVGADQVHLSIVGTTFGQITIAAANAPGLLTGFLAYPMNVASSYRYDGPPAAGESQLHFTLRDAADFVRANPLPSYMFIWDFIALDGAEAAAPGTDSAEVAAIIDDYDDALGDLLSALSDKGLLPSTNILFTLDHGKVDTHKQVALGTRGGDGSTAGDGQLAAVVAAQGSAFGLDGQSYALLNEDGDALLYARVDGAGTAAGAAAQSDVTHRLVSLVQSGALIGVDTTRTMTADGYLGTRRFRDARANGPNQADLVVFPQDDWTLNQVDATNTAPGPFQEHTQFPYARHGGFSADELYVPLIMAGPAFKTGALIPHPIEHADVAPTALATLSPPVTLRTAARGPIHAAFAGDPGDTIALPAAPETARDLVLAGGGFLGPVAPRAITTRAVIIDAAGLYEEEVFDDPVLADAAAPLRELAARGTRFEDCWTRSRDWPVTEYQMLVGGLPADPAMATAEEDPAQTFPPGAGLLAMPPPARFVASSAGYAAWRAPTVLPAQSLFDAAHALQMTTALLGDSDFHTLHTGVAAIDVLAGAGGSGTLLEQLISFVADMPSPLAVVSVGGARTADRHSAAARAELAALARTVAELANGLPSAMIVVTSRGATAIDDPGADYYGAGTSRHVPLIIISPDVRVGLVSGEPASPADIPATVLYDLNAPVSTDIAFGTWPTGSPVGGVPQPTPNGATEGRVLMCAFAM